jgi:hypothetical protein
MPSDPPPPDPRFELHSGADGRWRGRWVEARLFLVVAGSAEAPDPALLVSLRDALARWSEIQAAISAFVAALPPEHHVPLDPPSLGGFAARSCGFDEALGFDSLSFTDPDTPERAVVTFCTGLPDGYASYAVTLVAGRPTKISAFAS